jgi:ubiquinone/menaquinone biosynthesis C-methylase UbiE
MMKITSEGEFGNTVEAFSYATGRNALTPLLMPVTRWLRAINAEKYMDAGERHLDIGCGDGYFLRRCKKCQERYGLDPLLGDTIQDHLDFSDNYFDYVTMLAVIEHLSQPEKLMSEIWRVLKSDGKLIMTTPKEAAESLIRFYSPNIESAHETYFDMSRVKKLAGNKFKIIDHHTFIWGLNQVFCLQKNVTVSPS